MFLALRSSLFALAAASFLVHCSAGSQLAVTRNSVETLSHSRPLGRSWIAKDAERKALLYVSDFERDTVYVYSYQTGNLIGELTGFDRPLGECIDAAGDIFIVNQGAANILEYAHGGTHPIGTLEDTGESPQACTIDPVTGNLAVTNATDVAVYFGAQGSPTYYSGANVQDPTFCGYDAQGNLFIDGFSSGSFGLQVSFAELPKDGSQFQSIVIKNASFQDPGPVQWDGTYLAAAYGSRDDSVIFQLAVKGSVATAVSHTRLLIPREGRIPNGSQLWIQGHTMVAPFVMTGRRRTDVGFWHYPKGGRLTRRVLVLRTANKGSVGGVTVSPATGL